MLTLLLVDRSLSIKKILDDTKEDLDLYPDLTVADVWVDYGKARADGLDQRGSVRVLQKPAAAAPERFPSVEQDWDAAIVAYKRKRAMEAKKEAMEAQFPAIQEEDEESNGQPSRGHSQYLSQDQMQWEHSPGSPNNLPRASARKSPVEHRNRDLPLSSVETGNRSTPQLPAKSVGPTIAGTPPPRHESEELGESPSPAERRASSARSQPTAAPVAAGSPLQPNPQKLVKLPIASSTAKRTITLIPDDAESPPMSSAPNHIIPHQQTQSTKEATASSSDVAPESAPQRNVKIPSKSDMTNGVNAQGHLATMAKIVSHPQKSQAETVIETSSEESDEGESDSEDDKVEAEKKKNAEQDQRKTGYQTISDTSDTSDSSDNSDSSDSSDSSESESDSDSDASEENGPITSQIDNSNPITGDVIDLEGDSQMEEPVIPGSFQSSDLDLAMSTTNGTTHENRSRKRKQASEEPTSVKEARQGQAHPSTRPTSTPPVSVPAAIVASEQARQSPSKPPPAQTSPLRRRSRAPSFSSPARQASVREENKAPPKPPRSGIGLGITQSPPSKQPVSLQDSNVTPTQQSLGGPLFPSGKVSVTDESSLTAVNKHTPAIARTKKLQSAIRGKDSPATERRSVSFAEGEELASSLNPAPRSTPRETAISTSTSITNNPSPRKATHKAKSTLQTPTPNAKSTPGTPSTSKFSQVTPKTNNDNQTPKPASGHVQEIPSSSQVVYPLGVDIDQLTREIEIEKKAKAQSRAEETKQKKKEREEEEEIKRKLGKAFDPQLTFILTEMQELLQKLANSRLAMVKRKSLRDRLEPLRNELKACEQKLEAQKSTPRAVVAKKTNPTLKDILSSQQQEMAAKLRPEPKSARDRPSNVYEVPSSGKSESGDDSRSESDSGDIMASGQLTKLPKSFAQRANKDAGSSF